MALKYSRFGAGTGDILLDNVNCQGNETSLVDCQHAGWGVHNCGHHEDVSVLCADNFDVTGNNVIVYVLSYLMRVWDEVISVGAQSTLGGGQDIFARKYMHEKLTKFPNFT